MAINVNFQNLAQANIEILKAFNSANSAKALEAYQPLSTKERKLQKLRALQILKQSSDSETLADISLNTDSLAIALTKADGATLQAMLNLLSAKMIEQNKYSFYEDEKREDIKKKVQEKLNQHQEKKQDQEPKKDKKEEEKLSKEDKEKSIEKLINAAKAYFQDFQKELTEIYSEFIDNFSQENLKKVFDDGVKLITRYAYEVPIESFKEFVLEPIQEFRANVRKQLDEIAKGGLKAKTSQSFSHKEIRSMLKRTLDKNQGDKLQKSISEMNKTMLLKKKIKVAPKANSTPMPGVSANRELPIDPKAINVNKKFSAKDLRLALHK